MHLARHKKARQAAASQDEFGSAHPRAYHQGKSRAAGPRRQDQLEHSPSTAVATRFTTRSDSTWRRGQSRPHHPERRDSLSPVASPQSTQHKLLGLASGQEPASLVLPGRWRTGLKRSRFSALPRLIPGPTLPVCRVTAVLCRVVLLLRVMWMKTSRMSSWATAQVGSACSAACGALPIKRTYLSTCARAPTCTTSVYPWL